MWKYVLKPKIKFNVNIFGQNQQPQYGTNFF